MKIRGELFSATQRSEFENLKKFGKCSSSLGNRRMPKYTRCISTYSEQVLRATPGSSHSIKFVFSRKLYYINYLQQS